MCSTIASMTVQLQDEDSSDLTECTAVVFTKKSKCVKKRTVRNGNATMEIRDRTYKYEPSFWVP
jgi:hypothetical protein